MPSLYNENIVEVIIVIQFLFLFYSSGFIANGLYRIFYSLTHSKRISTYLLALTFFIGTCIHECAHYIMAKLLFVRTGSMSLFPKIEENGIRLGSVQIAQVDPIRRLLVGVAPVLVGAGLLVAISYYFIQWASFSSFYSARDIGILIAALYSVFVITNTMFSSKKDMEGAIVLLIVLVIALATILLAGKGGFLLSLYFSLRDEAISRGNLNNITLFLLFPIICNSLILVFLNIINKRRG